MNEKRITFSLSVKCLFIFIILQLVLSGGIAVAAENKNLTPILHLLLANKKVVRLNNKKVVTLNDTGITWGGSYPYPYGNNAGCTGEEIGAQDCSHGRDVTSHNDADGHAGFSFTKLASNGTPLANQAADYATTPWSCVQDNVTGLTWEVKTADDNLHDHRDRYTWYNTNPATNGGAVGVDGYFSTTCPDYYCNTQVYVARVNAASWCGKSDWRLPTRKELQGIVSYGLVAPSIDTRYFPNASSSFVWSSSPYVENYAYSQGGAAWTVDFNGGKSSVIHSGHLLNVWLVRDGQ